VVDGKIEKRGETFVLHLVRITLDLMLILMKLSTVSQFCKVRQEAEKSCAPCGWDLYEGLA